MHSWPKLLFQRAVIVSLAIALQIGFLILGIFVLQEAYLPIELILRILSWILVVSIISDGSNPSYKIAWILPILAFPVAGVTVYLLFGGNRIPRHVKEKIRRADGMTVGLLRQDPAAMQALAQRPDGQMQSQYLLNASGYPVYDNAVCEYYPSGEECYREMLVRLEQAERYIFLEFFIIQPGIMFDPMLEILCRKAAQGVDVRILYDDFGCIRKVPMHYARKLRAMGLKAYAVHPFIPILSARLNNRDHRKLLIVDGTVGFTGGINLADEYINRTQPFGHWKDCGIRICGPAVLSMTAMFLSMWDYVAGAQDGLEAFPAVYAPGQGAGFVQPFADTPLDGENVAANVLHRMIFAARKFFWIMTPYLVLDDRMTNALICAAASGTDVRIITPGTPDKWYVHAVTKANYELLTKAGVRIFEYTPGFLHAKCCLADDQCAMVGTVNLDFRSLYLHFEDSVYLCDTPAVGKIRQDFEKTLAVSKEITYAECRHVHLYQRVLRALLRLLAPLM